MDNLFSIWEFLVDVVCMMPPLERLQMVQIPSYVAPAMFFGAIAVFMFSLAGGALRNFHGHSVGWLLAGIVVVLIAISSSSFDDSLKSVFLVGYPAMVISMRFIEGALIGAVFPKKVRIWHICTLAGLAMVLYFVLVRLDSNAVILVLTGWSILGIVAASLKWTASIASRKQDMFNTPLAFVSLLCIFAATLIYVSQSPFERSLFKWIFPLGLLIGFLARKRIAEDKESPA